MKITALHTPKSTKGAYAIVYDMVRWPAGTLKNRGWAEARVMYERAATTDEVAELEAAWRFMAFRYPSWDALAADEQKYGIDANVARKAYFAGLGVACADVQFVKFGADEGAEVRP